MTDDEIIEASVKHARDKKVKKDLFSRFADTAVYKPDPLHVAVFMAGSPGAGKTEFTKFLSDILEEPLEIGGETYSPEKIVRIDPDEVRKIFSVCGYTGANSSLFQRAVAIGVDDLFQHVVKYKQNFILDGTFSSMSVAEKNITKCIEAGYLIRIYYLYLPPLQAWEYTKAREAREGRNIPKESFIEQLFSSRLVVNTIKGKYKEKIRLAVIDKNLDLENKISFTMSPNVDNVDNYAKVSFTREQLAEMLN